MVWPLGNAEQSRDSGVSQTLLTLRHLIAVGLGVGDLRSLSFCVLTCKGRPQWSPQRVVWKIHTKSRVSVGCLKLRGAQFLAACPSSPLPPPPEEWFSWAGAPFLAPRLLLRPALFFLKCLYYFLKLATVWAFCLHCESDFPPHSNPSKSRYFFFKLWLYSQLWTPQTLSPDCGPSLLHHHNKIEPSVARTDSLIQYSVWIPTLTVGSWRRKERKGQKW